MRTSRKNSNYLDKGKIVFIFNQSVNNFNTFCRRPNDDESYETLSLLNEAGERLYESFEAAIKRTLVNHFREKQANGTISWPEYAAKKRYIEGSDRNSLISMQKAENPSPFHAVIIDYNIIQNNAYHVTNAKKHKQHNVIKNKYCESLPEIRKYISAYVDPSANLVMDSPEGGFISLQAEKLFSETNYFDSTGKWNYVLLTDSVSNLPETQKIALTYIKWSMVLDFDSSSNDNGLAAAFLSQYKLQAGRFAPEHPEKTQFNRYSTAPYWFYLNGINGLPTTLTDGSIRRWNQKYASILYTAFQQYHATFEKGIKVVVLSSDTDRVSRVAEALDSVYEDDVQFLLLSTNHPALLEKYAVLTMPLTVDEFARSILANKSFFNADDQVSACLMPSKDGTLVSVIPEHYNHFELIHQNAADEDAKIESRTQSELFYQGREQLSWYGAKQGFPVLRNEAAQRLKKRIAEMDNSYGVFTVWHDPGIGGSTFARNLAYNMRLDYPVCILRQYIKETTATQLSNLYKELRSSIIIFIDQSLLSSDQVSSLENEIKPMAFPFIIIYSCRKKNGITDDITLSLLNDFEFDEMVERLRPYSLPTTLEIFKNIKASPSRKSDRSPFIMSLYTFEENFAGVGPYIRTFLKEMTEEQKEILVYLSLADYYANKPISEVFFFRSLVSSEEGDSLWDDRTAFDELVILVPQDNLKVYKIRHPLFAKEIINQIIYEDHQGNFLPNEACASNLISWLVKFINYSKSNTVVDYDSTLDILRNLFIVRDGHDLNRGRFSSLIEKVRSICSDIRDGNNRAGMVFKTLVEVYPEDPHFLAHLSRFYTYVEKNYDKGVEYAANAIALSENYEGKDPILYHIYGMSLKLRIKEVYKKHALECHERGDLKSENKWVECIIDDTDLALEKFEDSRSANNQDAGYQAAIDLCIIVLELAKSLSNIEDTDDFISKDPTAWYMKYLDEADELLRSWKNKDDTSFYQLQDKLNTFYGNLESLERTIAMWRSALDHAKPEEEIQRRRLLARAKQRKLDIVGYQNVSQQDINEIINLAELNISKEPKNSANIRLWFETIRYSSKNPEILLDEALDKLSVWKESSGSLEAYYYYFICNCIKAIEGSSRAESEIPILQNDLKSRAEQRYDNRYIYEWLGEGKGLNRLKHFSLSKMTLQDEKTLYRLTGYIEKYKNPGSATIRSHNMEVFFNPKRAKQAFSQDSEGTRVSFAMGFSYDGLRAYDQSVVEVVGRKGMDSFDPVALRKIEIGSHVKCRITRNLEFYTQAKLVDYYEQNGSIHISELGSNYSADNRPHKDNMFFATVIGPQVNGFWQLSLKDTAQKNIDNIPEWKIKLRDIDTTDLKPQL